MHNRCTTNNEERVRITVQLIMENRENIIKWLHISDIHMGHNDYSEQAMREELPRYLKNIAPEKGYHLLLFTGDYIYAPYFLNQTSQINIPEIKRIKSFIRNIQRTIDVNSKRTCLAIGNHDVIRMKEKDEAVATVVNNYRTGKGNIDNIDTILRAENRFARLYQELLGRKYPLSGHYIELISLGSSQKLEVLHLDTTLCAETVASDGKTKVVQDGNLLVGVNLLHEVLSKKHKSKNPIVAIGHHPLNTLADEEQEAVIREMEGAGIRVYFCGHTHTASIKEIGNKIIQICCGTNMERKENGNPADMVFYTGEYDLVRKAVRITPHQFYASKEGDYRWGIANKAPFQQTQFEKDIDQKVYYCPREKAPYYTFVKRYGKQIETIVNGIGSYVDVNPEENPKRPQAPVSNCIRKIYEADTGYGKTVYLKKQVSDMLSAKREAYQKINDIILKCEAVFPFYINLQPKRLNGRLDTILALLINSICGVLRSDSELKAAVDWITKLATNGRMNLLVDGFDRIGERDRERFTACLQHFLSDHPTVNVSLVSKPYVFDSIDMQKQFKDFSFYQICAFNDEQIRKYCRLWYENEMEDLTDDMTISEKGDTLAKQILADPPLRELAGVPLLLNTLLQVSKSTNALPKSRIRLYDNFVFALLKDRPTPEMDMQILATIAFEMRKNHESSLSTKRIRKCITEIENNEDWLSLAEKPADSEMSSLLLMNNNGGLLKKRPGSESYVFYNEEIQDYFTSLALAKGYYADLTRWMQHYEERFEEGREYPLVHEIKKFWDCAEDGNMILLTILQMNVYETFMVVEELLNYIASEDTINGSSVETNSHLRNLLLRAILEGACVCKEQRKRAFETVQKVNLFSLQADVLEKVFNSQFSSEFEKTCSLYISALFRLLRENCNPIQYLCNMILPNDKIGLENGKLEKALYVLDGVIWSKGRKYVDVYRETNSMDLLEQILEKVLYDPSVGGLCKRRVCGVLHRLLTIQAIDRLNMPMIQAIFDVYGDDSSDIENGNIYAGIRIFDAIPLNEASINYIRSMNMSLEHKKRYEHLFESAENQQDKLSSFEATILCQCWNYQEIQTKMGNDDLFKTKIVNVNNLQARLQILKQHGFFE